MTQILAYLRMFTFAALLINGVTFSTALAATYEIDPAHSSVGFKVKHLAISSVKGGFSDFTGTFVYDPADIGASRAEATVKVPSIDTAQSKRDDHLRSPDFFNSAQFPTMSFRSTKFERVADGRYSMSGDLTIRDITKPVVFDVQLTGTGKGMQGEERAAFYATTTINRRDFGLTWNKVVETGALVVGDDVVVELDVQGVKK